MAVSNVFPPPRPTTQPDGDVRPASATESTRDRLPNLQRPDDNPNETEDETEHVSPVEIAREAYARYEARGRENGHDVEDWLAAEEHLRRRK